MVEVQDSESWTKSDDGTHERAQLTIGWQRMLQEAFAQFDKPLDMALDIPRNLQQAGFVNVVDDVYKIFPPRPLLLILYFNGLIIRVVSHSHMAEKQTPQRDGIYRQIDLSILIFAGDAHEDAGSHSKGGSRCHDRCTLGIDERFVAAPVRAGSYISAQRPWREEHEP